MEDEVFDVVHPFVNVYATRTVEEITAPAPLIIVEGQLRWNGTALVKLLAYDAQGRELALFRM